MVKNDDGLGRIFDSRLNTLLCSGAFVKASAVRTIAGGFGNVMLLDFDLMYGGYVESGLAPRQDIRVYRPDGEGWPEMLSELAIRVSEGPATVIVDSLNGFFGIFDDADSGRYAEACMMMISSITYRAGGRVFLTGVARLRDDMWNLVPSGRRVMENDSFSKFFLSEQRGIIAEALSHENRVEGTYEL